MTQGVAFFTDVPLGSWINLTSDSLRFFESSMRNLTIFATAVMLTLTLLMVMPTYVKVHAVTQNPASPTAWSPFGPATPILLMHDYSDSSIMFNAFASGQVDITDWPIRASDLGPFCTSSDIWCSAPDPELGVSQLDVNNHAPFMGQTMETTRPTLVGSVTNVVLGSSSACANGSGQLTLNVVNVENNTQPFKDSSNTIGIANQPSGTPASPPTNDQGGSTPTGTYVFPSFLAGTYLITGSIVVGNSTSGTHLGCGAAAGCTVVIPAGSGGLGGTVSATWNVVWNSPSTLTPSTAMPNILKAIAHLVNKPEFVQHDAVLNGNAACLDTLLAPAHLIQGSPCVTPRVGQPGSPFPSSVLSRECFANGGVIKNDSVITSCNPISAYNLVDANTGAGAVWWGVPGRTARGSVATGYASPADIDAACQYLLAAGFQVTGNSTKSPCVEIANASVGTVQPGAYPHFTH